MKTFTLLMLILLVPFSISAQELEEGKVYNSGSTITSKLIGIGLKVPTGFKAGIAGEFLLMEKTGTPILLGVRSEKATLAEAKAYLSVAQDLGEGYLFAPSGAPTVSGDTVRVNGAVSQGLQSLNGEFIIRVGKYGYAVGVIGVGDPANVAAAKKTASAVAKSITFKKPFVPKPGKSSGAWVDRVKGYRLKYMKNSGGFSDTEIFTLCGNGTFNRYSSSSAHSQTDFYDGSSVSVSAAGQASKHGKWSVVDDKLHLFYANGNKAKFTLTYDKAKSAFLMNGSRYFREPNACP